MTVRDGSETLIKSILDCGIGICDTETLRAIIERLLFSSLIPDVEAGQYSRTTEEAAMNLWFALTSDRLEVDSVRNAIRGLSRDPEVVRQFPVEIAVERMDAIAAGDRVRYSEAMELSALPWSSVETTVGSTRAMAIADLHEDLDAIVHECEEGYVNDETPYPGVLEKIEAIRRDLRSFLREKNLGSRQGGESE